MINQRRIVEEAGNMASAAGDGARRRRRKTACVTGGSGYIASALVKMLLEKGYAVKTTVRNPGDTEKNAHLKLLQALGPLEVFRADLDEEGSFDDAVTGCDYAFLVAAPVAFMPENPEEVDSCTVHANKKGKAVAVEVPFSLADPGSPVSYNSQSEDEEVESWNVASFIRKEVIILQKSAPRNYLRGTKYRCPYHQRKPTDGSLEGLIAHARDVADHLSGDARKKAQHKAVLEVLRQAGLA